MPTEKCAYCPELATDREHVVPKCLMLDKRKSLLVPSCRNCNNRKGREDEYLRDFFTLRAEILNLPELLDIRCAAERSLIKRFDKNPPIKQILSTYRKEIITGEDDITTFQHIVHAENSRIIDGLFWIVRGLNYYHRGITIPIDAPKDTWSYNGDENKRVFDIVWPEAQNGPFSVGGMLNYKVSVVKDVPEFSDWHLVFYDRLLHIITVDEKSLMNTSPLK
ncbi:MAG: hypothetical protein KF836_06800 [Fimbriimonadaceae bacterium]|nr:hypothetical protein [Fimbriimonadaceae bacterium]